MREYNRYFGQYMERPNESEEDNEMDKTVMIIGLWSIDKSATKDGAIYKVYHGEDMVNSFVSLDDAKTWISNINTNNNFVRHTLREFDKFYNPTRVQLLFGDHLISIDYECIGSGAIYKAFKDFKFYLGYYDANTDFLLLRY